MALPVEYTGRKTFGRKIYRFTEDWSRVFHWVMDDFNVTIPRGTETDFATIPWPLHYVMKPDGPWAEAAAIHDTVLRMGLNRWIADALFRTVLLEDGISAPLRALMFYAVRFGSLVLYR